MHSRALASRFGAVSRLLVDNRSPGACVVVVRTTNLFTAAGQHCAGVRLSSSYQVLLNISTLLFTIQIPQQSRQAGLLTRGMASIYGVALPGT